AQSTPPQDSNARKGASKRRRRTSRERDTEAELESRLWLAPDGATPQRIPRQSWQVREGSLPRAAGAEAVVPSACVRLANWQAKNPSGPQEKRIGSVTVGTQVRQTVWRTGPSRFPARGCFTPDAFHRLAGYERREDDVTSTKKRTAQIALGAVFFIAGMAAGSLHARSVAGQNRFGQPKTVLHVVIYKFKDATSNNDREIAINGIKEMAGKIPGIKNVWLKTE